MKKIFYLLAVVGVVLTGCKDKNSPENSAFTFTEDVSKPLEFDNGETERALTFEAQADWSASIQDVTSQTNTQAKKSPQKAAENSATWVIVSPMSGQKGKQQITITCEPNNKETERSATITISDGVNTITITIVQKAQSADFDVFSAMDDAEFKAFCEQFDSNKDGKLSLAEANAIIEIYVPFNQIYSLKGIAFFTNLTKLDCSSNRLTSLDVSKNTALTTLDCYINQLTSLDVSNNTKLRMLDCDRNNLKSLDVSKNTALTTLDCKSNQITSLDVSNNTKLDTLCCSGNLLTLLDVSKNTALTYLRCYENQITSLGVSSCAKLYYFECYGNQITSLDVNGCTKLECFFCYENQLTSLDVSSCTALEYLSCHANPLQTLYMKTGQTIEILSKPDETEIVYK